MIEKTYCIFCKMETSHTLDEYIEEEFVRTDGTPIYCCNCCGGKYGDKIIDNIYKLDFGFKKKNKVEDKEETPFTANIELKGGNKQDIINVIVSMMDSNNVTLEEVEANQY